MALVIISSLISGIVGVIISIIYHRRSERRLVKIQVLRNVFGYKFQLRYTSSINRKEFNKAINEIPIVFYDSGEVLVAHKNLYETLNNKDSKEQEKNKRFIELYKSISKDLKLDLDERISDEEFLRALN